MRTVRDEAARLVHAVDRLPIERSRDPGRREEWPRTPFERSLDADVSERAKNGA
jgi:hypothetical protein